MAIQMEPRHVLHSSRVRMSQLCHLALLVALVGCTNVPKSQQCLTCPGESLKSRGLDSRMWIQKRFAAPFLLKGWVASAGCAGIIGDPVEAFLKLYLQNETSMLAILSPSNMASSGAVRIRSGEQAINFVQFFTRRDTFFLFDWPDALDLTVTKTNAAGLQYGAVPPELYRRLRCEPAVVSEDSGGYVVRRYVVQCKTGKQGYPVSKLVEHVGRKGQYYLISSETVAEIGDEYIMIPGFM